MAQQRNINAFDYTIVKIRNLIVYTILLMIFPVQIANAQLASPNVVITELNGQQVYEGNGDYDQIDYEGNSADYLFVLNPDNSVSATKPDGVTDRLILIDGFWFNGEQAWYAIDSLSVENPLNQTITGTPDNYDQVDYPGFASDYTFIRNVDLSVTVLKPNESQDTLIDIDGFWFLGEEAWYPINDLITVQPGDQTYTGTPDNYDQVDYVGASTDYIFELNNDGSVSVTRPDGGTDTLIEIDGFWFQGEQAWYPIDALVDLTSVDRTFTGTADAYDQVDYDGSRDDYIFVDNGNGTVSVVRPDGGTDTLTSIDGFWFLGEEAWYSIDMVLDTTTPNSAPVITTPNADQDVTANTELSYDATQGGTTFTDADGDNLTYAITINPNDGIFTAQNGVISGTPTTQNSWTVDITASDGTDTSPTDSFIITSTIELTAVQQRFGNNIELDNLLDYETRIVPNYIREPNVVTNPVTNAGATLGRVLFYDPALSIDDTVSCSSCHQQGNAFSDLSVVSDGVDGGQTGRHSMRLINTQWSDELAFFWDERAEDLEAQVTAPIRDHNEHGFSGVDGRPDFNDLIAKLDGIEYYQELFTFVYGTPEITEPRMQSALAQFVNSIVSFDSRFDEGRAQVDDPFLPFPNFTFDENEGKNIFMSGPEDNGAGCRRCHADPVFSVFEFSGQVGVIGVANDPDATDLTVTRSPSLRDVFKPNGETNGPFMHDGSMATMRDVMDHYDAIPVPTEEPLRTEFMDTIDPQLVQFGDTERLNLSDTEKDQVEAFLRTLTGQTVYTDPKWSNPFPAE